MSANMKPGKNGYKIYFSEKVIVMNYTFAARASQFGTREYSIIKSIHDDFPGLIEVIISGRQKASPMYNKRLTYSNMENHIQVYENAEELLSVFESVKALSKAVASPYAYVMTWFQKQFPDYKSTQVFKDGKLMAAPVELPNIQDFKIKKPKAA